MEHFSIVNGCRLKEEIEVAEHFRKELGTEKAIPYCKRLWYYYGKSHSMNEYWKKVIEILENPLPKL